MSQVVNLEMLDGWGDMKYENFETRATVQRCKETILCHRRNLDAAV